MFLLVLCVSVNIGCFVNGGQIWNWNHETSRSRDINYVLQHAFDYHDHKGQFGIGADDSLSMAEDPQHPGQYVLRVFYKKGTWSGHKSDGHECNRGEKCHRGPSFMLLQVKWHIIHTQPSPYSTRSFKRTVSHPETRYLKSRAIPYEQRQVYFNDTFPWKLGGKLPGLWGGTRDCSGGRISDTCFSTRLMWRPHGDGEVYAYVTHNQDTYWDKWCDKYDTSSTELYRRIHCTPKTGISLGRGAFRFHHNKWHKIRQEVHLNSSPGHNGYIKLWVDDHAEVHVTDIIMRDNTNFDIDGIFFSTFYGGGNSSWACPYDANTYFRNFRLSTDTKTPSHSQLVG